MEKKTIGGFIAALRKANGMTQKELAELLHVSDKTVSRWERDEGAPDLGAIPALAEIFGVTCDELLRGARRPARAQEEAPEGAAATAKGEKQRQRLLAVGLAKYRARSFIAMGISGAGFIAAMAVNFGFLRAYLGFLLGAIFYLASVIFQAVLINGAFLSVSEDGLPGIQTGRFKWDVVRLAEFSFGLTACLLGLSFPLVVLPADAYVGLGAGALFGWGGVFAALALLLAGILCYFLNPSLLRRNICALEEKAARAYWQNHALKKKCAIGLGTALVCTLLFHLFGGEMLWSSSNLAAAYGTSFQDYESFIAYMEQDIPYDAAIESGSGLHILTAEDNASAPETAVQQDAQWYDPSGEPTEEDEARRETLEDRDGKVVCTYIRRNESVSSIRYSPGEGTVLPILVITREDYNLAARMSNIITMAYCLLYPAEFLAALAVYCKKQAR